MADSAAHTYQTGCEMLYHLLVAYRRHGGVDSNSGALQVWKIFLIPVDSAAIFAHSYSLMHLNVDLSPVFWRRAALSAAPLVVIYHDRPLERFLIWFCSVPVW